MRTKREIKYHWTADIVKYIASHAAAHAARRGIAGDKEVDELTLQGFMMEAFVDYLPLSSLIERERSIKSELNLQTKGDPCCDIAILNPWLETDDTTKIFTFVEMKRTNEKYLIEAEVIRDIVRLAILSKHHKVPTYFILCGRPDNINGLLSCKDISSILSSDDSAAQLSFKASIIKNNLKEEYKESISSAKIKNINSLLLSRIDDKSSLNYSSYIWKIFTSAAVPHRDVIRYFIHKA